MTISKAALAATLAFGGAAAPALAQAVVAPPAQTEGAAGAQTPAPPERQYTLSRGERAALAPAIQAVTAAQTACTAAPAPAPACAAAWATAQAALPAAQAGARGADAKYVVGQLQRQIGLGTQNHQLEAAGVDTMIASGGAEATQMLPLYNNQARLAADAGDIAKADGALDQVIALTPNDPLVIPRTVRFWVDRNNTAHALDYYRHAIGVQESAGHPVSVEVRRDQLGVAYRAHAPETLALSRAYLVSAPTLQGWHDALAIYREFSAAADDRLKLDIYRLMRAAGALTSERDYVEYADLANAGAMFGEVKSVLEAGFERHVITPANTAGSRTQLNAATQRTESDRASLPGERSAALADSSGIAALRLGDAFFGYGDYRQAVELYRAALQKGGQDANLVNTRLGAALALAGQRAEAETAFRAVTGPRAELAQLWLVWLSGRPAQ